MAKNHLIDALTRFEKSDPARVFAHGQNHVDLTIGEFFNGARRMAGVLTDAGVGPGDRVAVQVEKSMEGLQIYVATIMAGGVFLPLNPAYTASEVGYFLSNATPTVFICDPTRTTELTTVSEIAGVGFMSTMAADGSGEFSKLAAAASNEFDPVNRGPEDLAAILYTSGTTGRSKGAMLSHRALVSNSQTLTDVWQFTDQDVLIHALPIFHTHGLFVATNVTLMSGASIIFHQKFDAAQVLNDLPRATALMGVPTFYTRLLNLPGLDQNAAANMRLFISGSAPLLSETHEKWHAQTDHHILERYGMTETNMNTSNPYAGERRAGTVGFPLPDVELRICEPDSGRPVAQGEIGIIEVRGPNVFSGYWNMPDKTAEDLRENGFLITGDQGFVDGDGYIHIIGRSKDMVITGGFNVYPKEVENVLDQMDGIQETAVIGVPHPDFGEAVVAVVVLDGNLDLSASNIIDFLRGNIANFKLPKTIEFVKELPRNTMGKVQKNVLRRNFGKIFPR